MLALGKRADRYASYIKKEASLSPIHKLDAKSISLNKPIGNRRLVFIMFIFTLLIASAYFILFAHQQQQTLSIVVRPCGNDSSGV